MSIKKLRAFEYTCDATGCGVVRINVIGHSDDAHGFHGNAVRVDESGTTNGFDWYACKPEHIQSAVENTIKVGMQS